MRKALLCIACIGLFVAGCSAPTDQKYGAANETALVKTDVGVSNSVTEEVAAGIQQTFGFAITVTVDDKNRATLQGTVPTEDDEQAINDYVENLQKFDRIRSRIDVTGETESE